MITLEFEGTEPGFTRFPQMKARSETRACRGIFSGGAVFTMRALFDSLNMAPKPYFSPNGERCNVSKRALIALRSVLLGTAMSL